MFERLAIDLLKICSSKAVCEALRISWDEADGIKERAVNRSLARRSNEPVRRLCVDEKAVGRGHAYVTVVRCADEQEATAFFKEWCPQAQRTKIEPVKKVVAMFRKHRANIVTNFRHGLSNAHAVPLNNSIDQVTRKSCGYRNREQFKRDVMFHPGGLNLYPAQ